MTLISKEVITKWSRRTRSHYESLGYTYTEQGKEFVVKVRHLLPKSKAIVKVKCDYCSEVYEAPYFVWLNGNDAIKKSSCGKEECRTKKTKEASAWARGER